VQHGLGREAAVVAARTAEPGWVCRRVRSIDRRV